MSLNSNTTGLEEILASVNALPEAGGGGTIVTGSFSVSEGVKSSGTTIATVSGLGFKPKKVFIVMAVGTSNVSSTSYYIWCGMHLIDGTSQSVFANRYNSSNIRIYCRGTYVDIIINDDGFSLKSTSGSTYTSSSYNYIATSE